MTPAEERGTMPPVPPATPQAFDLARRRLLLRLIAAAPSPEPGHFGPSVAPERMATCGLSIAIDGEPVWPVVADDAAQLEIQADDLLSHLVEFWKPLLLRQVYPAPFNPHRPSRLRADALERWAENPPETADREDEAVTAFEEAHDLSRAFGGLFNLPSFWLLRVGDGFLCETQNRLWQIALAPVVAALVDAGNSLAAQLGKGGDKWDRLIAAWEARDESDALSLLAWSAGLDPTTSRKLVEDGFLEPPASLAEAVNDDDELRIAARLAGALPIDLIRDILVLARTFDRHEANALDDLAADCRRHIEGRYEAHPPYVQGEAAARHARDRLGIGWHAAVDVFEVARKLGAEVRAASVEPETLDGLAIWGSHYGPGMLLNLASERVMIATIADAERNPAARVTAAHELCHLLLEGGRAVSAVDVLMSRMPVAVEQRAKSFAGEFLLPSRTAARAWEDAGHPDHRAGLRDVLIALERAFRVPRAVASWKLDHGLQYRGIDLSAQLDALSRWR